MVASAVGTRSKDRRCICWHLDQLTQILSNRLSPNRRYLKISRGL